MQKIVGVAFNEAGKVYYYDPGKDKYNIGDYVLCRAFAFWLLYCLL